MQQSNRTEGLDMGRAKQRKTAGQHLTDSEVFEASIALAETVSTDGVLDSDKWEALMRYMGLRDEQGRPWKTKAEEDAAQERFKARSKAEHDAAWARFMSSN